VDPLGTVQFVTGKTAGAALFGSAVGTAHPLQGASTIPVIAGYWVPVIRYATIGGIVYTSTPRSGYNSAIDLATCLNPIQVQNFNCTNGTLTTGNYTHLVAYINGNQLISEASKTFAFDLDGTAQYLAYYFNGYTIADRLTISYVSGASETVLHDIVVGTDSATSNINVTPKILDIAWALDVVNISSFTYTAGDYLKIKVASGYNAPGNPNTNWDIKLKCLTTFDTTWAKPILDVCHPTLSAPDPQSCRTPLSIPFAVYNDYYHKPNPATSTGPDIAKYLLYQVNYTDNTAQSYPVDVLNPRVDTYFSNESSCSNTNVNAGGSQTVVLSAGSYNITKTGTTGNVTYTYVFSQQSDYDDYYNNYFTSMALLVPGYTPANRTFTLPSNTLIDYYKYITFIAKIANTPGDTVLSKDIIIHYGTFVNFDNATKTISFTLANITWGYITPPKCAGSTALAGNCTTLSVNYHNTANTVSGTYPLYNYTTLVKLLGLIVYGTPFNVVNQAQTTVLPWSLQRMFVPYWGSPYGVWPTSTVPDGFTLTTAGVGRALDLYRYYFKAEITNVLDPVNNYRISTHLDINGVYSATYTIVYEIASGVVITQNCFNVPTTTTTIAP
jgi:hypothetical protein